MENRELLYLPESNNGYESWIRRNQRGFVINAPKSGAGQMVWHQADCGHIAPDGQSHWVDKEYLKACSLHPGVLAEWACERRADLRYCDTCRDAWSKAHP